MPVPTMQAVRSPRPSARKSRPDCATASRAAISANCETRSSRTRRLESKCASGSKSRTSAAILTLSSSVGIFVIGPMPERPSRIALQVDFASCPSAQIAPIPVIATRRIGFPLPARFVVSALRGRRGGGSLLFGDELLDRLDQALDRFGVEIRVAVGHRDLVVVLDLENDLHGVERLDLQILERRVEADLADIDAGLLGNDGKDRFLHAAHDAGLRWSCAGMGLYMQV